MINNFADKSTEDLFNRKLVKRLPQSVQRFAYRKLLLIDGAERIDDLRKRVEFTNTLSMTDSEKEYQKVFKLIDKEMERREKINQRWSVKATCDYFARNELGIGNSTNQQLELDKFYKKYLIYKDNFNKNK